jgi:hypothetical protein
MEFALLFVAIIIGLVGIAGFVWGAFAILNIGSDEPKQAAKPKPEPVAWRVKHGKRYYYMDKTEPFPSQDAEPLYLGRDV